MIKEFKYIPPIKYLLQIPLGIIGGLFCFYIVLSIDNLWIRIFMSFFSFLLFAIGILFSLRCFKGLIGFKIEILKNEINLPFNHKGNKILLRYRDIKEIDVYKTFDTEVISLKSKKGFLEIEKSWMKKKNYIELLKILKEKTNIKTAN